MKRVRYIANIVGAIVLAIMIVAVLWVLAFGIGNWLQFFALVIAMVSGVPWMRRYIREGNNPLKTKYPEPRNFRSVVIVALIVFAWALLLLWYVDGGISLHFRDHREILFPWEYRAL